ncbi:PspA/IM30 family protein [Variovorax sp. J22P271]|uniref:PspA/IM30 family protein n=1 Tax=Variovorax davisae TaxID=3053515 RepID=UPI002575FBE9|nr:PspA/IM30 family protein [Variovorax sp. J22P271]MDM0032566.1 PspA/IM30 family protein [Variovorax sp. J22P271]
MADSLRARVTRFIAGGAHALVDRLEDATPVAAMEQSVREVDQLTDEVRAELGRVAANRHLAQQQHLHLNREHEELAAAVESAVASDREDLARPGIARQIDIEAQLPVLASSLAELVQQEKDLSGYVDALMGKRREMERAIREFEVSRGAAQSVGVSGSLAKGRDVEGKLQAAQAAFDRTYQRQTGLDANGRQGSLEQAAKVRDLTELVRDNKIAERLAALKAGSQ